MPGGQHKSYLDSCEKTSKWFGTHGLLSFVFLWARTSCIHCSNNHSNLSNYQVSVHTIWIHLEEAVIICRVKSYLRHFPMTPQNSNNVKEAGERNQLIALLLCFALTSQVLIEWLMLYFGSHCPEGASFCDTGHDGLLVSPGTTFGFRSCSVALTGRPVTRSPCPSLILCYEMMTR